jgi:hypothetical protein
MCELVCVCIERERERERVQREREREREIRDGFRVYGAGSQAFVSVSTSVFCVYVQGFFCVYIQGFWSRPTRAGRADL